MKRPKRKTLREVDEEGVYSFASPFDLKKSEFLKLHEIKPLQDDEFNYDLQYDQSMNAYWYTLKTLNTMLNNPTHVREGSKVFNRETLIGVINYLTWISALNHYRVLVNDYRTGMSKLVTIQKDAATKKANEFFGGFDPEYLTQEYLRECLTQYEPWAVEIKKYWDHVKAIKPKAPPLNPVTEMFNKYAKLDARTHKTVTSADSKYHAWLTHTENIRFETKTEHGRIDLKIPEKYMPAYKTWIFVTNLIATNDHILASLSIQKGQEKYYIPVECYLYLEQLLPVLTYNQQGLEITENHFIFIPHIETLIQ